MTAGSTYTPIASTTLASSSSAVTFNSFSGYTDLYCVYSVRSVDGAQDVYLYFNGDTGSNYSSTVAYANASSIGSYRATNDSAILLDYYGSAGPTSGPYNTGLIHIIGYSKNTIFKTVIGRTGRGNNGADMGVGLWRSNAAITSLTFRLSGNIQFAAGSKFTIYGIAAA